MNIQPGPEKQHSYIKKECNTVAGRGLEISSELFNTTLVGPTKRVSVRTIKGHKAQ